MSLFHDCEYISINPRWFECADCVSVAVFVLLEPQCKSNRKWRCYYTCCVFYVSLPTRYSLCSGSFVLSLWLPCGILDMRCAFINQSCCSFRQDSDSGVSKTCASKIFRRQMDFVASDLKSLYPKHSIYGIFMYQPQNFYLCQKFGLTITRDIDYKTWIWLHQSTYRKISILNI